MFEYEFEEIQKKIEFNNFKEATIVCLKAVGLTIVWVIFLYLLSLSNAEACSRDISELTPEVQAKYEQFKEACHAEGLDFKVICTFRSQQEQDELYSRGRTKSGNKVTWTKTSVHTSRRAFDIAVLKGGSITWEPRDYMRIGEVGKRYGFTWGGDWKVRDYGHFQLP